MIKFLIIDISILNIYFIVVHLSETLNFNIKSTDCKYSFLCDYFFNKNVIIPLIISFITFFFLKTKKISA